MSTTTIRLPDPLKSRVARAAKRAGVTTHAFILDAVAEKTEAQERREAFHDLADQRHAGIVASGKTIPWQALRGYLEKRAAGKPARRPTAKKAPGA